MESSDEFKSEETTRQQADNLCPTVEMIHGRGDDTQKIGKMIDDWADNPKAYEKLLEFIRKKKHKANSASLFAVLNVEDRRLSVAPQLMESALGAALALMCLFTRVQVELDPSRSLPNDLNVDCETAEGIVQGALDRSITSKIKYPKSSSERTPYLVGSCFWQVLVVNRLFDKYEIKSVLKKDHFLWANKPSQNSPVPVRTAVINALSGDEEVRQTLKVIFTGLARLQVEALSHREKELAIRHSRIGIAQIKGLHHRVRLVKEGRRVREVPIKVPKKTMNVTGLMQYEIRHLLNFEPISSVWNHPYLRLDDKQVDGYLIGHGPRFIAEIGDLIKTKFLIADWLQWLGRRRFDVLKDLNFVALDLQRKELNDETVRLYLITRSREELTAIFADALYSMRADVRTAVMKFSETDPGREDVIHYNEALVLQIMQGTMTMKQHRDLVERGITMRAVTVRDHSRGDDPDLEDDDERSARIYARQRSSRSGNA